MVYKGALVVLDAFGNEHLSNTWFYETWWYYAQVNLVSERLMSLILTFTAILVCEYYL